MQFSNFHACSIEKSDVMCNLALDRLGILIITPRGGSTYNEGVQLVLKTKEKIIIIIIII